MILEELRRYFLETLRPDRRLSVDEWSDRYRILSTKVSAEPGKYRTSRTPYLREIMRCLSVHERVEKIVFMKAAQVGATEIGNNWMGYIIDHVPGPVMLVQPTVEMAKRNSKSRIDPLIEECPRLKEKVKPARARDSSNTVLSKEFPGGILVMTGANSAVGLRSLPARFIFMDEIDGYPPDADGEGNPIDLAMARARTFTRRKYFMPSTPTVHGHSNVEREFEGSDQRYFHVPCPECGEYQKLVFAGLKWDEGRPETAWYECEHCQAKIKNHQKTKMLKAGQWVAENPESKVAGFHLNALYSPVGWYSWPEIVRDFLEAKKSPEKLKAFVNTVLAETWREESERPSANRLWERREGYRRNVVPQKVGFLTCGCDVQADRIELEVVGWCREKETFSVDYRVLPGDTSQPGVWAELDKVVYETWECEGTPARMPLKLMGVDSGYLTQTVYNWVRKHPATRVIAVKGVETSNVIVGIPRPADVTIKGKTIRRGVKVWSVGTNLIKSELYSWLRLDSPSEGEPVPHGFCHFPEYDEEFFKQLTAEEARVKFVKGYKRIEWEKVRERNEALDCRVYARAAASVCGLDRFTEQNWKALETERQIGGDLETENKPRRKKRKRESIW